ncbi:MAG: SDR family NAD(P)-dependent oxidoreductase [Bryobacteraceae bacterium]
MPGRVDFEPKRREIFDAHVGVCATLARGYHSQMPTALVTGASRGVGRGIAIGLANSAFDVWATGRSIAAADLPSKAHRIICDHTIDAETIATVEQVPELDVLVNSSWGGYERMIEDRQFTWGLPFWQQPAHRWPSMMDAGLRAAFVASAHAARRMVPRKQGLIVNISHWAAQKHIGNAIYGISKAATDKMTSDMAHELRPHNIAVVSLYPGMVRTEAVVAAADWLDLSNSESPEFIGLVIAALARDSGLMERSGGVCVAAALAEEYGVSDIDGKQPVPLNLGTL